VGAPSQKGCRNTIFSNKAYLKKVEIREMGNLKLKNVNLFLSKEHLTFLTSSRKGGETNNFRTDGS
jgi:hypothetical protein